MDGNAGLIHYRSAGSGYAEPRTGDLYFAKSEEVETYLKDCDNKDDKVARVCNK